MKLILPGAPLGASARPDGLGDEYASLLGARVVAATQVLGTTRGAQAPHVETELLEQARDSADVLELTWEGGIVELVAASQLEQRFAASNSRGASVLSVPLRQAAPSVPGIGPARGVAELALEAVKHLRLSPQGLAQSGAAGLVRAIEERHIPLPGVHRLRPDGSVAPERVDGLPASDAPWLVLVHGAFSDTAGSFADLFASLDWQALRDVYAGRLLALEQRTLTDSPAQNALDLLRVLPRGARVHLLSYSRGGLVGELLCRAPWRADEPVLSELFPKERYAMQHEELRKLAELSRAQGVRVERFARVACPAAGTLLASGRLDRYLSVLLSLVGRLSGPASPAFSLLKALALAIVGARGRADLFPGLEAMIPESKLGFMPFLNASEPQPGRELAIVAGDAQGGGPFQRLKAFFADLYYREDNDFVVDSKSMFGGVPRREGRAFYQRSSAAHHFSYFSMPETRGCAVEWLLRGHSERLAATESAELYGGLRSASLRSIPKLPGAPQNDGRPVAFLVPGIMGSHLRLSQDRIWISVLKLAWGGLGQLGVDAPGIECDGLVERYYDKLYTHLSQSHRVEPFAFDWRRSIAEAADLLAQRVEAELSAHQRPVRFMAHSMGGLVCRALIARRRTLWDQIVARGGRLVMLGTPNHGSYVPAQVLTRQHKLMQRLAQVDTKHDLERLTGIVGAYSGLLEMLPHQGQMELLTAAAWSALGRFAPDTQRLEAALRFREELARGVDPKHMVYVAGWADQTPDRMEISGQKIEFSYTRRGDGTVPWELGLLDGVDTYYVQAEHGQIPNHTASYEGFAELLERGTTEALERAAPWSRRSVTAEALGNGPAPEEDVPRYYPQADDLMSLVFGKPPGSDARGLAPLALTVTHGDVREATAPVLVGHYRGDKLVSVEKQLDLRSRGALSARHRLDLYPGEVGTSLVEDGVIVVGLGQVGQLTRATLEQTVSRALIEYALGAARKQPAGDVSLGVCSLLIGSYGGTRLSVEASIQAITDGALRANTVLATADGTRGIRIALLEFMELYDDIATEAAHAALDVAQRSRGALVAEPRLRQASGGLRSRPRSPYASGWSQRIQIRATPGKLCFHVSTDLARSEPYEREVQWNHVEPLLAESVRTDRQARAVLFRYLLPHELSSGAARGTDLVLDADAARLPWELLGPAEAGIEPLGVRFGVLRQLSTPERRAEPSRSKLRRALVIGNPKNVEPSLDGAREEARAVAELLVQKGFDVVTCIEKSADETFRALWSGEYDFIHIAAHGEYDDSDPSRFGVVLENGRRLTQTDFNLPTVPTLVFLNCCHLGALGRPGSPRQPGQLAASVAQRLISNGVKVVVAAGWAVSDAPAKLFATSLYTELLSGRTLMDAARKARKEAHASCGASDVTWGAYQVYGHDGFVLPGVQEPEPSARRADSFVSAQEFIDYIFDYKSRARSRAPVQLKRELGELLELLPPELHERGDVAHAIGMAFGEIGAYVDAIEWLERASRHSQAPFETAEQLANFEARHALQLPPEEAGVLFARAVERLEALVRLGASLERHALLASTLQRWSRIEPSPERIGRARAQYLCAARIEPAAPNWWYPALSAAMLTLVRPDLPPETQPLDDWLEVRLDEIEAAARRVTPPDLWSRMAGADVALLRYGVRGAGQAADVAQLYEQAFAAGTGASPRERDSVLDHFDGLEARVGNPTVRRRVADVRALIEAPVPSSDVMRVPSTPPRAAE